MSFITRSYVFTKICFCKYNYPLVMFTATCQIILVSHHYFDLIIILERFERLHISYKPVSIKVL